MAKRLKPVFELRSTKPLIARIALAKPKRKSSTKFKIKGALFILSSSVFQSSMLTFLARLAPFMVEFITDNYEFGGATELGRKGFKLSYFQDATGC